MQGIASLARKRNIDNMSSPASAAEDKRRNIEKAALPIFEAALTRAKAKDLILNKELRSRIASIKEQFENLIQQAGAFSVSSSLLQQMERSYKQLSVTGVLEKPLAKVLSKGEKAYSDLLLLFGETIQKNAKKCLKSATDCSIGAGITRTFFVGLKNYDGLMSRYKKTVGKLEVLKENIYEIQSESDGIVLMHKSAQLTRMRLEINQLNKEFDDIIYLCVGTKKYLEVIPESTELDLDSQWILDLEVNRADLIANPYEHLAIVFICIKCAMKGDILKNIGLCINFLGESGQDEGGLTQEYMNLLFKGLCTKTDGSRRGLFQHDEQCSESENVYQHLSLLLRYVYEKRSLHTGRYIDDRDVKVLFGFSKNVMRRVLLEESSVFWGSIETVISEFANPSSQVASMTKAIIDTMSESERKNYFPVIEVLSLKDPKKCSQEMLECVFAEDGEVDDEVLKLKEYDEGKFLEAIKHRAVDVLQGAISPYKSRVRSLMGAFATIKDSDLNKLNKKLTSVCVKRAVRAIANKLYIEGTPSVNIKIQGISDRKTIINRIAIKGIQTDAFKQKFIWFKEWAETAELKEWEAFLIFATGANCDYVSGLTFEVVDKNQPLLAAHTCFGRVDVDGKFIPGHDDTKEKFIGNILLSINFEGFSTL
jgi:hypothetical protein